jgi:chorismate synthase
MTHPLDRVSIRDLRTLDEYAECCEIQEETWGRGFSERVPAAILRVSQKIGGVTAGAFDANDRMVGFVFGLTGIRDGKPAHWSDMLAVRAEARGRHIGDQLKHYQREQVRALGVELMLWTCDPLVARNAHFNINRLGARPLEYAENMYGANTGSTLHGTLPTDRLVIGWRLQQPHTPAPGADAEREGDAALPLANPLAADSLPSFFHAQSALGVRVQVPHDLERVQEQGGDAALRWRISVREAFQTLLGIGLQVDRFVRPSSGAFPYYVLTPAH